MDDQEKKEPRKKLTLSLNKDVNVDRGQSFGRVGQNQFVIERKNKDPAVGVDADFADKEWQRRVDALANSEKPHGSDVIVGEQKVEVLKAPEKPSENAVSKNENESFNKKKSNEKKKDNFVWKEGKQPFVRKIRKTNFNKVVREVEIPEFITLQDLAKKMAEQVGALVEFLIKNGELVTANQMIDADMAEFLVMEFGHKPKRIGVENDILDTIYDVPYLPKVPVVAVLGHVDHGKTTLLDSIRKKNVASQEAGGITQNINAYTVTTASNIITFIDTPGHALFDNMRLRGSEIADIALLVVAADDGINAQTLEVIATLKEKKIPMVVALNKADKPNIDLEKVKQQLLDRGVFLEDFGGDVTVFPVSGKTGQGIEEMLDGITLLAQFLDLNAQVDCPAKGVVLESHIDKGRGIAGVVIVNSGTLKVGDCFVSSTANGKVRNFLAMDGAAVNRKDLEVLPGYAMQIFGWDSLPEAGASFNVVKNENIAREIAAERLRKKSQSAFAKTKKSFQVEEFKILNIVVKTNFAGVLDALVKALEKLVFKEVKVKVISSGVGEITENDVELANQGKAMLIAFEVRISSNARSLAKNYGIKVDSFSVIYDVIDEVKERLKNMLTPTYKYTLLGKGVIIKVFNLSKHGIVPGCNVKDGVIRNKSWIKVFAKDDLVWEGEIRNLKREKDDCKEAPVGVNCGILVNGFEDWHVDQRVECYEKSLQARELEEYKPS